MAFGKAIFHHLKIRNKAFVKNINQNNLQLEVPPLPDRKYSFGQIHLRSTFKVIQHIISLIMWSFACRARSNIGARL